MLRFLVKFKVLDYFNVLFFALMDDFGVKGFDIDAVSVDIRKSFIEPFVLLGLSKLFFGLNLTWIVN